MHFHETLFTVLKFFLLLQVFGNFIAYHVDAVDNGSHETSHDKDHQHHQQNQSLLWSQTETDFPYTTSNQTNIMFFKYALLKVNFRHVLFHARVQSNRVFNNCRPCTSFLRQLPSFHVRACCESPQGLSRSKQDASGHTDQVTQFRKVASFCVDTSIH